MLSATLPQATSQFFSDIGLRRGLHTIGGCHNCGQATTFFVVARKSTRGRRDLNPRVAFGLVLRALRQEGGYSQDSFAHRTGYHRNYIGQLERGEKSPSLTA